EADGRVWLTPPQPPWRESPIPEKEIFRLLGGDPTMRDRELPILAAGWKLFVPLCRRADLFALAPRWEELAATGFGAFAFTRAAIEPGGVGHARFFAPAVGVREDPVTGAAHGPLAAYLAQRGVLAVPARARAEQGDAMGKPGRVDYDVTAERARIGGDAGTGLPGEARAGLAGGRTPFLPPRGQRLCVPRGGRPATPPQPHLGFRAPRRRAPRRAA